MDYAIDDDLLYIKDKFKIILEIYIELIIFQMSEKRGIRVINTFTYSKQNLIILALDQIEAWIQFSKIVIEICLEELSLHHWQQATI